MGGNGWVAGMTTQRSSQPVDVPVAVRRSFMSRISLGHVIMIVAGLAAFLLVFSILRTRDQTFAVATAAIELRAGTTVQEGIFDYVELGASDRNILGSFLNREQVGEAVAERWVVTRTIPAGDPVRFTDFRTDAGPSELRAMSVPIDRGHAVAGVLQSGDRVDVIVVRKGIAAYVATGIEVLDVAGVDSQFAGGFSVTVAVDGPTSLRLASAVRDGGVEIVRATGAGEVDPLDVFNPSQDERLEGSPQSSGENPDPGAG